MAGESPANPVPADTKAPEPKVLNATLSAGAVIGVLVTLAQFLYSRADLIAFLPDWLEPIVLAVVTALATYSAGYATKHQWRTAGVRGSRSTVG